MVEAWFEQGYRVFQEGLAILAVELPFRVPIVSARNDVLETPLEGVIDAIYLTLAEEVVIVDHKTSAQGFGQTFIEMDLQATAYAAGALLRRIRVVVV